MSHQPRRLSKKIEAVRAWPSCRELLLAIAAENKGVSAKDAASRLGVTPGTIRSQSSVLSSLSLVTKVPHHSGKRGQPAKHLALTPEGSLVVEALRQPDSSNVKSIRRSRSAIGIAVVAELDEEALRALANEPEAVLALVADLMKQLPSRASSKRLFRLTAESD